MARKKGGCAAHNRAKEETYKCFKRVNLSSVVFLNVHTQGRVAEKRSVILFYLKADVFHSTLFARWVFSLMDPDD